VRVIVALLAAASCLSAQPSFLSGPKVTNLSHSSVRVAWITNSSPASSEIEWGLTTSYGQIRAARAYNAAPYTSSALISGLTPNTTYHCRARLNGGAGLSGDVVFTTAAEPTPHPAPPAPPSPMEVSLPPITGNTFAVNADCSNLQTILSTLAGLTGSTNHEVVIPAGTTCYGNWTFPNRPNHTGWVVVRSSAVGTPAFPPEGVRWTPNWPVSSTLATFVTRALGVAGWGLSNFISTGTCASSGYYGEGALYSVFNIPADRFSLVRCSDNYSAYTGDPLIDSMSGSLPVTVTADGHGLEEGRIISIPNNGYVAATNYYVYDVTPATFKIYASGGGSYTGGVSFTVLNQYRLPAHTKSSSDPSGPCVEERWWFNPSNGRMWWCAQGVWTRFEVLGNSDDAMAAIKVSGNRYRFVGLEVTGQQVPGAPNSFPAGWDQPGGLTNQQGVIAALVYVTGNEAYFDRCYIHGQPKPGRYRKGFLLSGDSFALMDSYVTKFQEWRTGDYWQSGGSMCILHTQGGPALIRNNHLEAAGINYFTPNPAYGSTPVTHDVVLQRNTFKKQPEWRRTGSQPYQYPNRHAWELKQGQRYLLEGNIFDYNWSGILAGAFISSSPRCPYNMSGPYAISTWNGNTLTLAGTEYFRTGDVIYISGADAAHNGLWEVAGNGCPSNCLQITLAGSPAGSGSGGTAHLRASAQAVTDVEIRHNSFHQGTEVFRFTGADPDCPYFMLPQSKRLRFHNNLVVDMNIRRYSEGGRVDLGGAYAMFGDYGARSLFLVDGDFEDLAVTHNTLYGSRGNMPVLLVAYAASEGLVLSDNIHTFDEQFFTGIWGSGALGTAALNATFRRDGTPGWTALHNVMCCGWSAYQGTYPATFRWPASQAELLWLAPSLTAPYNYRLRHDSSYLSGGANRASDGLDTGGDMDALEAAQGRVGNTRVHSLNPGVATLSYLAPDEKPCTVEIGTSPTWGTGTRIPDGGGLRARNVPLSGLAHGTLYHYRVLCAVEQPSGSFLAP